MTDDLALWTARCIARALVNGNNADAIALVRNASATSKLPIARLDYLPNSAELQLCSHGVLLGCPCWQCR